MSFYWMKIQLIIFLKRITNTELNNKKPKTVLNSHNIHFKKIKSVVLKLLNFKTI